MKDKKLLHVRMGSRLKARITKHADRSGMTLSGLVSNAIAEALDSGLPKSISTAGLLRGVTSKISTQFEIDPDLFRQAEQAAATIGVPLTFWVMLSLVGALKQSALG